MRIRSISLINNFFKDESLRTGIASADKSGGRGEYCCLGYFDALDVWLVDDCNNQEMNIRKKVNEMGTFKLDGTCSRKNIVCITDNDEKDKRFWIDAKRKPFLFVSMIRIKRESNKRDQQETGLDNIIEEINKDDDRMAYYTYDHSDVVVVKYGESYCKDLQKVLEVFDKLNIFKMYSIFAIKEEFLENYNTIRDEIVCCQLKAAVKNMKEVTAFLEELESCLQGQKNGKRPKIEYFIPLGNYDIIIRISNVSLVQLLSCYKDKQLLTHDNDIYKNAFFNVESQIFEKEIPCHTLGTDTNETVQAIVC